MKKTFTALALSALLVAGCAKQTHYINGYPSNGRANTTDHHFFLSGIAQSKSVNASAVCGGPQRVVAVETVNSPINVVLHIVTWGIYTPRSQTVYCR